MHKVKEEANLIKFIMKEFSKAVKVGMPESMWIPFKQACQKSYLIGKNKNNGE